MTRPAGKGQKKKNDYIYRNISTMHKTILQLFFFLSLISSFFSCNSSLKTVSNLDKKMVQKALIRPQNLKEGDTVIIIAPAGTVKEKYVNKGVTLLKSWGLEVKLAKNLYKKDFTFAGTDAERLEDLQNAFDAPNAKAIWCARGGYGAVRIIDGVDWSGFEKKPKWVIGFSDITVLHNALHNRGFESMHALMPISLSTDRPIRRAKPIDSLKDGLFGNTLSYEITASKYNKKGTSQGQIVGGNLAIVYSLLESNLSLDCTDKIIFIEEVGEYHYAVDRMLISLRRAGYFEKCKGLIIGGMSMKQDDPDFGKTVEEIVLDACKDYDFPIVFDFPAGHIVDNRMVILGRDVTISTDEKTAKIVFLD
jgi:muramoyltetrapeptide carboxypeptidase